MPAGEKIKTVDCDLGEPPEEPSRTDSRLDYVLSRNTCPFQRFNSSFLSRSEHVPNWFAEVPKSPLLQSRWFTQPGVFAH